MTSWSSGELSEPYKIQPLGYATHVPRITPEFRRHWLSPLSALVLSAFLSPFFMCMCGHMDGYTLSVTVPGLACACYGWIANKNRNPAWRLFLIAVVVVATLVLFKNAVNILWTGHHPCLDERRRRGATALR